MALKIDWEVLDKMLMGLTETDDITIKCKEEIYEFLQSHSMGVFSEESLNELAGIFELSMKPAYEEITHTRIPNIFYSLVLEEEEEHAER